jgi:hypothetical protein
MKIAEYNEMMAYLLRPAQEAKLVDDLEPGSLRDELLKDFDPSQETYEEYLQRKSMRENAAYGGRMGFDKGGMAKLVSYVEGLPKGATVTLQMVQDYVKKNNINVNINNFFSKKAKTIKDKIFISDTRSKDFKLTSEEKANIEKYGQEKYDKLTDRSDRLRVRRGQDVGSLALDKQQKVKFKKEYDKAIKYYKKRGIEEPNMDSIRKNIARNDGKFNATGTKLQDEAGLTGLFKKYEKADLIADLKKGKTPFDIAIEYFDKNEKEVLKLLEGKNTYSRPLGRLSTDLINAIAVDKEATKLYDKIKKTNSFNKLKNRGNYIKAVETLIPFAQEQGLIPNLNLNNKKITTATDYFNYAYKVKRDPIAKLFGFYERVGIEHPGGVARALIFDDPATLNEIVATMPDTNISAGRTYDTYATGQARFFEKTKDPKYIKKINKIILNKQKEYGKPRTILDVDGDKVTRRTTKFSLTNPDLIEDSKSFINEYIVAGGSQRKNFNKLDPSLQQSILAFEEGDKIKGNKFLKTALKDTGAEADFQNIVKKLQNVVSKGGTKGKAAARALSIIAAGVGGYNMENILKGTGLMDKEFEQTASASDAPLVEEGFTTGEKLAGAGAAAGTVYKFGKPILSAVGKVAGAPTVAAGLSLSNILDYEKPEDASVLDRFDPRNYKVQDDPNLTMAGLDLLLPEILKKGAPRGSGILSTIGRVAANPFFRTARAFTPVGAGLTAIGLGKDAYERYQELEAMSPAEREELARERDEFSFGEFSGA